MLRHALMQNDRKRVTVDTATATPSQRVFLVAVPSFLTLILLFSLVSGVLRGRSDWLAIGGFAAPIHGPSPPTRRRSVSPYLRTMVGPMPEMASRPSSSRGRSAATAMSTRSERMWKAGTRRRLASAVRQARSADQRWAGTASAGGGLAAAGAYPGARPPA